MLLHIGLCGVRARCILRLRLRISQALCFSLEQFVCLFILHKAYWMSFTSLRGLRSNVIMPNHKWIVYLNLEFDQEHIVDCVDFVVF